MKLSHEQIETNPWLMIVLIVLVVSVGGLVQIVPLFFQRSTTEPLPGMTPPSAPQVAGPLSMRRTAAPPSPAPPPPPFRAETLRYGPYSVAGESVWDHPFQWGSKRTGPDLARVGGRYSDDWHRAHLHNPRDVVPESNMPAYPWLEETPVDQSSIVRHMKALRSVGVPFSDESINGAVEELEGKTEQDALIAFLQGLGRVRPQNQ